jgi:replication factor A1
MKIKDIVVGAKSVTVEGTITALGEKRSVNLKSGGTNTVLDATLKDDSGEIKVPLWGADADKFRTGDKVKIENGYVTTFKGINQLSVGKFGKLTRL